MPELSLHEPGLIVHVRRDTIIGRLIRGTLDSWGNHDAITVQVNGGIAIGESVPLKAKVTPVKDYALSLARGKCQIQVFKPLGATREQCELAAAYWMSHIRGTWYSFSAYPRLLVKSLLLDWTNSKHKLLKKIGRSKAGFEWSHWCTEGVARAWREGMKKDVWRKPNPTPLTTEKRARGVQPTLLNVTTEHVIHHPQQVLM